MKAFWSCREAARQAASEQAGLGARLHLLYCRHCRRFLRQLAALGPAARAWASSRARPGFEERLLARLRRP